MIRVKEEWFMYWFGGSVAFTHSPGLVDVTFLLDIFILFDQHDGLFFFLQIFKDFTSFPKCYFLSFDIQSILLNT